MKKLNNKGVTLIELIVSFMLVSVAIIYFFQTLYTVKSVYKKASRETNEFVIKDYSLRIIDAYYKDKTLPTEPIYFDYNNSSVNGCDKKELTTIFYKYESNVIKKLDVHICNIK